MKKTLVTIFWLLLFASASFADMVDNRLPLATPEELKASTRQMIGLGIKSDEAVKITRAMLQNHFNLEQILKAQLIVMQARRQNLPTKPIVNKAFEGMAKDVMDEKIVRAMEVVRSRYAFAYAQAKLLSHQKARKSHLEKMLAGALTAGLSKQDAAKICNMVNEKAENVSNEQQNDLAFEVLKTARDMARLSVTSTAVTRVLVQALHQGFSANEIKSLRASFMFHSRSTSPQNLARSYSETIGRGKGLSVPGGSDSMGSPGNSGGSSGSGGMGGSGGGSSGGHR